MLEGVPFVADGGELCGVAVEQPKRWFSEVGLALLDIVLIDMEVTWGMGASDGSGVGDGSGSGFGTGHIYNQMREFISLEITRSILEQTHVMFGTTKEGIMEILDEQFGIVCS